MFHVKHLHNKTARMFHVKHSGVTRAPRYIFIFLIKKIDYCVDKHRANCYNYFVISKPKHFDINLQKGKDMIISLANQKGGVGKTTSAVNIAATVASLDKKVLLIDLDPQGNASTGVGFMDRSSLRSSYDVITGELAAAEAIYSTEFKNLDVMPSHINLAGAELEIAEAESRERLLRRALSSVKDRYDYIFIDCQPALGLLTINALVASDGIIIPVQCEFYALEGLIQLTNTIESIKSYYNPELELIGLVITMFNSRLNISQSIIRDLRSHYGNIIFKTPVVRNVRLAEAPSYGTPILYLDKFSKGAQNYMSISKELIERTENK